MFLLSTSDMGPSVSSSPVSFVQLHGPSVAMSSGHQRELHRHALTGDVTRPAQSGQTGCGLAVWAAILASSGARGVAAVCRHLKIDEFHGAWLEEDRRANSEECV